MSVLQLRPIQESPAISHLRTTSCSRISFFNFSSPSVTLSNTGHVLLYLDAKTSASLILSDAVFNCKKTNVKLENKTIGAICAYGSVK